MYNSFDYQIETALPAFRIPTKLSWLFYAFWVAFIACLGAAFYFQIQLVGVRGEIEKKRVGKDTIAAQLGDFETRIKGLEESNRKKEQWFPLASIRPSYALLMAKILEASPPSMSLQKLVVNASNLVNGEQSAVLSLRVVGQQEKATQTVVAFRNAFREFDSYTRMSNTDNNSGRTALLRGIPEFSVNESWVFNVQPKADLFKYYERLNTDFPVGNMSRQTAKGAK